MHLRDEEDLEVLLREEGYPELVIDEIFEVDSDRGGYDERGVNEGDLGAQGAGFPLRPKVFQ